MFIFFLIQTFCHSILLKKKDSTQEYTFKYKLYVSSFTC